ncbi:MAG: 3-oxoacyl-ACP synthase III [Puniceicoccaceae bacterium]
MRFERTRIAAVAHALPEEIVTSDEIEERLAPLYERLRMPVGRIEWMTGIRARRLWPEGTRASEASAAAGRAVLAKCPGAPPVDLLVHAAVSRDRLEPATAAYVHESLGLGPSAQIFDLSNACLGFLNAMVVAGGMIESGLIRTALVVAGENGRPLLERTIETLLAGDFDRKGVRPFFANLTIGCGAVAMLLCDRGVLPEGGFADLEFGVAGTDGRYSHLCEGDQAAGGGLVMQTDSEALLEAGIGLAADTWRRFRGADAEGAPFARIITHQVGKTHQRRLHEALGIDPELDFPTYPSLGNVGSVACPITLSLAEEAGALAPGGRVALLGIGSGLSSVMLALRRSLPEKEG